MKRPGATLTEVLVAIFVMALGLISLLTLFPLGALSMAQAIKDSRAAQAAANGFAVAETLNIRNDPNYFTPIGAGNAPFDIFENPQGMAVLSGSNPTLTAYCANNLTSTYVDPTTKQPILNNSGINHSGSGGAGTAGTSGPYTGPGFPVFVDPIGYSLGSTTLATAQDSSGNTPPAMPRMSVSWITGLPPGPSQTKYSYLWFSLLDDMTFDKDMAPGTPAKMGVFIERENRYTWAYLLRRPRYQDPSVVEVSAVVYSGRAPQLPLGETAFTNVMFDNSGASNLVTITYSASGTKPNIKKGSWILDATMVNTFTNQPDPHGFFYRVVNVTDFGGSPGVMQLELQTIPKVNSYDSNGNYGVLVVMDNVVEVFDKGSGWEP
jgi:hypothetical protein